METFAAIVTLIPLALIAYKVFWMIRKDSANFVHQERMRAVLLRDAEAATLREIPRDEHGMLPLVTDGNRFYDAEAMRMLTMGVSQALDPQFRRLFSAVKLLAAGAGASNNNPDKLQLPLLDAVRVSPLPRMVKALDLFDEAPPSLKALPIGVGIGEDGEVVPVVRSLHKMMHTLAIGRTEAGKSTWLLSFLAAVIRSGEPVEVVAIDVSGAAFNILSRWERLRYPVARTVQEAIRLLQVVETERLRRKDLYEQEPMADSLKSYNGVTKGESLVPWIVLIDEGTMLLAQAGIGDVIKKLALATRQYGIYAILTGHSANASVFDTVLRGSFVTRIGFSTEQGTLRTMFEGNPPRALPAVPGRGWAQLGGKMIELQAPFISKNDFRRLLEDTDQYGIHEYEELPPLIQDLSEEQKESMVKKLLEQGMAAHKVEEVVFGYSGGAAYYTVRQVREGMARVI